MFEKFLTKHFFGNLYKKFSGQGWAMISKAPKYLNVALPDFSVEYYICSFHSNDHVVIHGKIPDATYVSLVTYNTEGNIVDNVYLNDQKQELFETKLGIDLEHPNGYYAIILRVYQKNKNVLLPNIDINGKKLKKPTMQILKNNSTEYFHDIIQHLIKYLKNEIKPEQKFFLPVHAQTRGLFYNADARYMIGSPGKNNAIIIKGKLPKHHDPSLKFIGFMASNLKTTETDDSVGWRHLPLEYTIYVVYSKTVAKKYGYDKMKHHLLLWNKDNKHPIIVYREVRTEKKGLFLLQSNVWTEAKKMMGENYPEIIFC